MESRLIKEHARALEQRRAEAAAAIVRHFISTPDNVDCDSDRRPIVVNEPDNEPDLNVTRNGIDEKDTDLNVEAATDDAMPEGNRRSRMRDLLEIVNYIACVSAWYAGHVARGKWQAREIARMKSALAEPENEGIVAIFTIDMKSKTKTGKHIEEQGHGMGAKGMSLQGEMLHFYENGRYHRQDKTRHDKTPQDKTKQDKTSQNQTRQDQTRQRKDKT